MNAPAVVYRSLHPLALPDCLPILPMGAGIMNKVLNSGEIADWNAHAVYENDDFDYLLGDDQRIYHKPTMGDPGQVVGAYSIVKLKDGTISRDFMPRWRIEKAREQGMAKNSLQWTAFYDAGAIKTVIKHHAKIGRAHASTPSTNAHPVCRLQLEKKKTQQQRHN